MSALHQAPAFEGLLFTVFQQLRQAARASGSPDAGLVIAFSSANSGEGVTHTIEALLAGLSRESGSRTLLADSRHLRGLTTDAADLGPLCRPLPGPANTLFELTTPPANGTQWEGSWEYRRDIVARLRQLFDYVLLDCPALRAANDVLSVAPFVDGVILVIEADKTRKDQILHAEKSIEFARGKLIGHILNKRTYVVPEWLYGRL